MAPLSKALPLSLLLGLAPLGAQDAAMALKASELPKHAFTLAGLQVTVLKYRGDASLGRRDVTLSIRNPTQGFLAFATEEVTVVGADGGQSILSGWSNLYSGFGVEHPGYATRVRIAPGATLELGFFLERAVKAPAKLYLGDRFVAEITD